MSDSRADIRVRSLRTGMPGARSLSWLGRTGQDRGYYIGNTFLFVLMQQVQLSDKNKHHQSHPSTISVNRPVQPVWWEAPRPQP